MDRMNHEELRDYAAVARLEDLPVSRLLDFHNDVGELKDYCSDLLDCFKEEQRYSDESLRYADICAKETVLIEDMGILLKKIIHEHTTTMKVIRKSAEERREEYNGIKVKKEAK